MNQLHNFEGVSRKCDTVTFLQMKEQAIKAVQLNEENNFMRKMLRDYAEQIKQPESVNPQRRYDIATAMISVATVKSE